MGSALLDPRRRLGASDCEKGQEPGEEAPLIWVTLNLKISPCPNVVPRASNDPQFCLGAGLRLVNCCSIKVGQGPWYHSK